MIKEIVKISSIFCSQCWNSIMIITIICKPSNSLISKSYSLCSKIRIWLISKWHLNRWAVWGKCLIKFLRKGWQYFLKLPKMSHNWRTSIIILKNNLKTLILFFRIWNKRRKRTKLISHKLTCCMKEQRMTMLCLYKK